MSDVTFISPRAEAARRTAADLVARRLVRRGTSESGVPCWVFEEAIIIQLTGGVLRAKDFSGFGFRPVLGQPGAYEIVCSEGPASVVLRLDALWRAAA